MYKTILVDSDIEDGRRVLRSVEQLMRVAAAFWSHSEEEDRWKLVVVSPDVDEQGPIRLYTMIQTMLRDLASDPAGVKFPFSQIMVVSPKTLLYKELKQRSGPVGGPVREGRALVIRKLCIPLTSLAHPPVLPGVGFVFSNHAAASPPRSHDASTKSALPPLPAEDGFVFSKMPCRQVWFETGRLY